MASRRLIHADGTHRTYESLNDAGEVIGQHTEQYVFAPEQIAAETITRDAEQSLDGLRQIVGTTGTLTGAQLSNAVRLLARVVIRLVRLQLRKLDGAD